MAKSTGPMLAVGGLTMANQSIAHDRPVDWRIPVATGLAIGVLALIERASEPLALGLAYTALITVLFVRVDPKTPTVLESLAAWVNMKRG